jgi:hypothetical protein
MKGASLTARKAAGYVSDMRPDQGHVLAHTSPIRVLELKSMLFGLLCPIIGLTEVSTVVEEPFTEPSALLLHPWAIGESTDMGLAAVSPVRGAFAASIRIGAS